MLILPAHDQERLKRDRHEEAKRGLTTQFNGEMEKILNQMKAHDKYWILGKVRFPPEYGGKVGRVFLEASLDKPDVVNEAFLYEVDNRSGSKTLLWVTHPDKSMRLPTLGKTISIAPK